MNITCDTSQLSVGDTVQIGTAYGVIVALQNNACQIHKTPVPIDDNLPVILNMICETEQCNYQEALAFFNYMKSSIQSGPNIEIVSHPTYTMIRSYLKDPVPK